ncbi:MAG: MBL fold metallo-hydrolase [Gemmatimonadales bacterium]
MIKVAVLGSGSRGNAIALRAEGTTVLIDAGFGLRALAKRAARADVMLDPMAAIALTHEHGDHVRGAAALAHRYGCPVLASPGTLEGVRLDGITTVPLLPHESRHAGPFRIEAARTSHDATEPVALTITSRTGTKVGVAYDLGRATAAVRYLLRDCTVLILEANHDEVMLQTGPYPATVRHRISGSTGHLSNRCAAELAAEVWSPALEVVVLVHVSERCNRVELARDTMARALRHKGFSGKLLVAGQDEPLPAFTTPKVSQLPLDLPESPGPPSPSRAEAPTPASYE